MALLNWPDFLERVDNNKVLALELAQDLLQAQVMRLERLETALSTREHKAVEQASHAFRGLLAPYGPVPLLSALKALEESARGKTLTSWELPAEIREFLLVLRDEVTVEVAKLEEELKSFEG